MDIVKKILMVSFVALLAGVGSGHAAIPSTNYVEQGLGTKVDKSAVVGIDKADALMSVSTEEDLAEYEGRPLGADTYATVNKFQNMITNAIISGEEVVPWDINGGPDGGPEVLSLETPNKRSVIDGVNSVYDVVKTNETNIANKVDKTDIAEKGETVSDANSDKMVPSVARMAQAIADAVSTGVGAVDLNSRVAVDQGTGNANKVMVTGADGKVTAATTIAQDKVENLTTDLSGKIGKTQVLTSKAQDMNGNNVEADAAANPDAYVATWGAVEAKVESEVGSLEDNLNDDFAKKVDKTDVIKADGTSTMGGTSATDIDKDAVVPTVANVEANFIPNVSDSYVVSTNGDLYGDEVQGKAPAGSYIITVDVDENGKATYHWIAYNGSLDT